MCSIFHAFCNLYLLGSLIGVNLSEVETMGIEEINDFRWTMKVYASKIWQHRYELMQKDKLNILEYQFPPCISHDNINTEYTDASKQIQLKIKFEKDEVEFPVTDTTLPSEILDEAINSLEIKHDRKNLCLKMYGKEEYLIKEYYLSKYASIQEDISNYGKLCLVVKVIDEVIMKLKPFVKIKTGSQIKRSNTTAFGYSQRRKKDLTVSSLELEDNFKIEIGSLKYVDSFEGLPSDSSPWLRISIFHGNVELVDHIDTNVSDILTGTGDATHKTNNEHSKMLEFNIAVKKLPRNARLCFGIYYKDRRGKNMFIGWANRTIFNFKGVMKKTFSMFFSESSTEKPSHDLLNPYKKTEETNFEVCCCTVASLEVTFFNSFEQILTFPEEWLLDWHSGDTDSDSNPRGRRKTIHYFSEVSTISLVLEHYSHNWIAALSGAGEDCSSRSSSPADIRREAAAPRAAGRLPAAPRHAAAQDRGHRGLHLLRGGEVGPLLPRVMTETCAGEETARPAPEVAPHPLQVRAAAAGLRLP